MLLGIALVSLLLRLIWLDWGIPEYDRALLPRSEYRHSYHLDEDNYLWGLALMHDAGDWDVRVYHWGTLQFFLVDGPLLAGSVLGVAPAPWHEAFLAGDAEALPRLYMLGRSVSVVMGVACTLLVAGLGVALAGWRAGLMGGTAYAIAPLAVTGAHYLTNDVTMSAFLAGSVLSGAVAVKRGGWGWLVLSGLLLGLATSAKYSAAFSGVALLAAQGCCFADGSSRAHRQSVDSPSGMAVAGARHRFASMLALATVPWLAAIVGFVLGMPYMLFAPEKLGEGLRQAQEGNALDLSQGWGRPLGVLGEQGWALSWLGLTLPFALLAIGGIVVMTTIGAGRLLSQGNSIHRGVALVILAGIAGGVVGIMLNRVPMLRYTHTLLPLLAACAGVGWALIPMPSVRWATGAAAVAVAMWVTLGQLSIMAGPHPVDGLQAWLKANLRPGQSVARLWPEYPVLDGQLYRLTRMDPWRPDLPPDARPDYIILDNMALGPPTAQLTDLIRREYKEVVRFGARPSVLGIIWDEGTTPHDWKYSHPELVVYMR